MSRVDGATEPEVVADSAGRITLTVDLGPAHQTPLAEQADGYFTTRTVRFTPMEAP